MTAFTRRLLPGDVLQYQSAGAAQPHSHAAARNIADGEMVEVYNDRGSYQVKVKISNEIKPGCLNQAQGWWPKHFTKGHYAEMLHMELNKTQDFLYETNYAPYDNLVEVKKL